MEKPNQKSEADANTSQQPKNLPPQRVTKSLDEIIRAHDTIHAIIIGEVPNPFGDSPLVKRCMMANCEVLCWLLGHDEPTFGNNLAAISQWLREKGYELVEKK